MTKQKLLKALARCAKKDAPDGDAHIEADAALLAYIDDAEIAAAYERVAKWYA